MVVLGGIGVWSVTRVFIGQRMRSIAVMKCLGATSRQILGIYVAQVATLGLARQPARAGAWRGRVAIPARRAVRPRQARGAPDATGVRAGGRRRRAGVVAVRARAAARGAARAAAVAAARRVGPHVARRAAAADRLGAVGDGRDRRHRPCPRRVMAGGLAEGRPDRLDRPARDHRGALCARRRSSSASCGRSGARACSRCVMRC